MYTVETAALARESIEDRIRGANRQRLARELQHPEQPATTRTATREPRPHSRLRSLVHFRQAYS